MGVLSLLSQEHPVSTIQTGVSKVVKEKNAIGCVMGSVGYRLFEASSIVWTSGYIFCFDYFFGGCHFSRWNGNKRGLP